MNANGRHYSLEELNELIDAGREAESTVRADPHLEVCGRCRQHYQQLHRIDRSLGSIPLPETGRGFTQVLMKKVSRGVRMPIAFWLLEHAASFLGALVVLAIIATAFLLFTPAAGLERGPAPLGIIAKGWSSVSGGITDVLQWCIEQLSQLGDLASYGLLFWGIVALLVVIDRLLARGFSQRVQ